MARSFTPGDARSLIAEHNRIQESLKEAVLLGEKYESELGLAIARLGRVETEDFLRKVPVNEIFPGQADPVSGATFSQACRNAKFRTAYDLYTVQVQELSSKTGMSLDHSGQLVDAARNCYRRVYSGLVMTLEDEAGNLRSEAEDCVLLTTKLLYLQKYASVCRKLQERYQKDAQDAIADLQPGTGRLGWFFSGAEKKQRAERGYAFLYSLLNESYGRDAEESLRGVERAKGISMKEAVRTYFATPDAYYKVLSGMLPGRFARETGNFAPFSPFDAADLVFRNKGLLDELTRAKELDTYQKRKIIQAVNKYREAKAVSTLRQIPIEELNRPKRGIKTGLLRENGFETIADAQEAPVWKIEAIKGIGEGGARFIKDVANTHFEDTVNAVRIRLNADDRNTEASQLVTELVKLRLSRPHSRTCTDLLQQNQTLIEKGVRELDVGTGLLRWLFASSKEREIATDAFAALRELLEGGFEEESRKEINALADIHHMSEEDAWGDFAGHSIELFTMLDDLIPGICSDEGEVYGLPEDLAKEIQVENLFPGGLLCELRRYQEWGVKYILHQGRVLLGDEMGLGKTVQAIAAMVSLRNTGATHFMVVCPASVITNWCREIQKHSRLNVVRIHGPGRLYAYEEWLAEGGVAVTTYETTDYLQLDENFGYSMLVVDEAHYIKNPNAKRTGNVIRISEHAERLLFMTGTALENRVDEMISLIAILQPQIAEEVRSKAFLTSAPQFREKIAPVYYRRRREDVLSELPDLIESREWCTLTEKENAAYVQAVLSRKFQDARRVSWNVEDLHDSSKAQRLMEIIEDAQEDGRKVIVFSFFLDTIRKVYEYVGSSRCLSPIHGSVPPERRQFIVDQFEKAPAGSVLLAQIQTGGTGLNIQAASVVVICEPQFKPSVENQAIARAYRMGQTRNVMVYRLLCDDTVDERITEILEEKQHIFDEFADESVSGQESLELDEKTFGNIIQEEIERISGGK